MSLEARIAAETSVLPRATDADEAHLLYQGKTIIYRRNGQEAVPAYDIRDRGITSVHRDVFAKKALEAMNDAEPRLEAAE